jgi:N-sulfoglucosamine sulfohydrolase
MGRPRGTGCCAVRGASVILVLFWLSLGCQPEDSTRAVPGAGTPPERPNILWIVAEDLCPRIGAYGDRTASTPRLDSLASEGVVFTNAFTTSGVCAPSRSAIITGVHQNTIGTQHMRTKPAPFEPPAFDFAYEAVPPPEVKAFPEYLRAAGYFTVNNAKTDYQFGEPFTVWDESGPTAHWRNRPEGMPFFAYFTLLTTHESTIWPLDYRPRSLLEFFTMVLNHILLAHRQEVTQPGDVRIPLYYPENEVVREDIARFYDNIALMDTQVGRLLDELEQDGLADDTIVLFTGDNGDGLPRAKRWVYDGGIHVPLILRWPGHLRAGAVRKELVSFVDLAPTFLSLAGAPVPDHMQGRVFLGKKSQPPRAYVYAARDRTDTDEDTVRAVRDRRFKYLRNFHPERPYVVPLAYRDVMPMMKELLRLDEAGLLSGPATLWFRDTRPVEELYDTLQDPDEVDNLADRPEFQGDLIRLRTEMDRWLEWSDDIGVRMTEAEMVEGMWPGGVQPLTEEPEILMNALGDGQTEVRIQCPTEGASVGYRVTEPGGSAFSRWLLYSAPLVLESGTILLAEAVRYGYHESGVVKKVVP